MVCSRSAISDKIDWFFVMVASNSWNLVVSSEMLLARKSTSITFKYCSILFFHMSGMRRKGASVNADESMLVERSGAGPYVADEEAIS